MNRICHVCGSFEFLTNGQCRGCVNASHARWRAKNKDKIVARDAKYVSANRTKILERQATHRLTNRANRNAIDAFKRAVDPKKYSEKSMKWQRQNPEKASVYFAKYRASRINATPLWANAFFISEAYHIARLRSEMTGVKWHIVPLQSKSVCGLHTENNLQVITASSNCSKGNRTWSQMP